jgi:Kae1-associated kinase Bud32
LVEYQLGEKIPKGFPIAGFTAFNDRSFAGRLTVISSMQSVWATENGLYWANLFATQGQLPVIEGGNAFFYNDEIWFINGKVVNGEYNSKVYFSSNGGVVWKEKPEKITVKAVGGILNDVYLIKTLTNNDDAVEHKFLVKRFREWSNFKWFPLMLWTFGTRTYAISGKSRLAKECATSEFLRLRGFNVPKILYVSTPERLVFMEYIEGENLSHSIKRLSLGQGKEKSGKELAYIETVGELFAKVHSHGMTLGDTKPENVIISKDGTTYLIDFEQATQDGDKTWDIAVFLYYAGHYLQPIKDHEVAEDITMAFIKGYLRGGGQLKTIRKSTTPKYTRVFSIFTMPSIILTIINTIKKTKDPVIT